MVSTRSLRPNRHDTGSTTARSVDEIAPIRTLTSLHACVDRTFVKSVAPACREFFLVEALHERGYQDPRSYWLGLPASVFVPRPLSANPIPHENAKGDVGKLKTSDSLGCTGRLG